MGRPVVVLQIWRDLADPFVAIINHAHALRAKYHLRTAALAYPDRRMTLSLFIRCRAPPASPQSFATQARSPLVVPNAQHLVSLFSQKISSRFVLFHFGSVLHSVKLDYQAMFETAEIGDKRAHSERGSQTRPLGLNLDSLAPLVVRTSQTP